MTTHINREVALNISTVITVILWTPVARATRWAPIRKWQKREVPGQNEHCNQLEREALPVDRGAFGRSRVYVRRSWNRGWWVTTRSSEVEGFAESEVRVYREDRVAG